MLWSAGASRQPREPAGSRAPSPRALGSLSFPPAWQMDVAISRPLERRFTGNKCGREELQPQRTRTALSAETLL